MITSAADIPQSIGALHALLTASCRLWDIEADVCAVARGVEIRPRSGPALRVERVLEADETLPLWCLQTTGDAGAFPPRDRLRSVNALIRQLRIILDPGFAPQRAVIGARTRSR